MYTNLYAYLAGLFGLFDTLGREISVMPATESILQIPLALAVSHEHYLVCSGHVFQYLSRTEHLEIIKNKKAKNTKRMCTKGRHALSVISVYAPL